MIQILATKNSVRPDETEKASNAYLVSIVVLSIGFPILFLGVFASLLYFLLTLKDSKFVKWHCHQALFSQIFLLLFNVPLYILIIKSIVQEQIAFAYFWHYLVLVLLINLIDFGFSIVTIVELRKGNNVRWFGLSKLVDKILGE
ncbi:MAG: DUF4870 domain-containing protein [Bacteroidota bacterium]